MPFLRKYGAATHVRIPIVKRAVVDFAVGADWTPATGDVKISKDGGAAGNVTNLPTAVAMGNTAYWDFSLTATELQAASLIVTVADSATKAVEDQAFVVNTYGNASAQILGDLDTVSLVGSAMTLTSGERTSIGTALLDLTDGVETSLTLRQALRLALSALAGKLSGAATTTVVIRNVGDTKNRITATVDANGNRSSITTDLT